MTDPDNDRPGSRGYYASPAPPSPRPSVASRASRSSLRRDQERQEPPGHPRPASVPYSRPHTPQYTAANPFEEPPAVSPRPAQPTPAPFSPLFTLLTSTSHPSNRQTIQYPIVHYVFADDDPEALTAALAHHHGGAYPHNDPEAEPNAPLDRAVLLDMERTADGSGVEVAWASSLTPDWAVASAHVSRMEAGGGSSGGVAIGPGGNQVLKIEGVSIEPSSGLFGGRKLPTPDTETPAPPAPEEYADLLQEFDKRMSTLRKVVEAASARQRALGDGGGQFSQATAVERIVDSSRPEAGGEDAQTS